MAINPNRGIGTKSFLRGITPNNGGKQIPKVAAEIADTGKAVAQDALDTSLQSKMASDLKPLRQELSTRGLSVGQTRAAIMAAGAIVAGPSGVVVTSMADRLSEATSTRDGAKSLADQAVAEVKVGGMEEAQLTSLGNQVTAALTADGTKPGNVPVALFMGGAVKNAEAMQDLGPASGLQVFGTTDSLPDSQMVGRANRDVGSGVALFGTADSLPDSQMIGRSARKLTKLMDGLNLDDLDAQERGRYGRHPAYAEYFANVDDVKK